MGDYRVAVRIPLSVPDDDPLRVRRDRPLCKRARSFFSEGLSRLGNGRRNFRIVRSIGVSCREQAPIRPYGNFRKRGEQTRSALLSPISTLSRGMRGKYLCGQERGFSPLGNQSALRRNRGAFVPSREKRRIASPARRERNACGEHDGERFIHSVRGSVPCALFRPVGSRYAAALLSETPPFARNDPRRFRDDDGNRNSRIAYPDRLCADRLSGDVRGSLRAFATGDFSCRKSEIPSLSGEEILAGNRRVFACAVNRFLLFLSRDNNPSCLRRPSAPFRKGNPP